MPTFLSIKSKYNFLFLGLSFITFSSPAYSIVGGQIVTTSQYQSKSTVMVLHETFLTGGRGQCSGTLISRNLVLTAAHCVVDLKTKVPFSASYIKIHFGNYDGENWDMDKVYEVEAINYHVGFDNSRPVNIKRELHDIALVKLKQPAPSGFEPVKLLKFSDLLQVGQAINIAGFGDKYPYMGDPSEPASRILRMYKTEITQTRGEYSGMLELLNTGFGMAAGDSGGPAYAVIDEIPYLIGVASGYKYKGAPSYEHVPDHFEWITETAKSFGLESEL